MVFLVAWWLLGPLVYMIPPKTELVTHWLFIHYSDRGPGVVVVFRPLEWPYREVSLQTNTKEYKDINTETADAIPVNMNAVLRWFITNSVKAATNVVGDIRNAMSGIAQPAIMEAAGAVTYDTLRAHKGDVTTEIRKRAQEELDRLDKQDRGMGVDVQIELQDTPISDPRVREAYSSPIEAAQRGKGLEAMIAPTIKYVLEQAAKYKEEFPKATAQDIIDLITSLRDSDAVEKTPAALVQRAIHAFGGGRIHPDSGEG
jgi:regulator of protease activity HflC (stomatin/prohibitin superfamily)